ncbi:hypothetical protein Poli38472_014418 [Pythium oligandrum]|uniref:Uncharacterized protein n=1 Tax=Pythium oligandrum TaxID=41045 RepID=A0A8K1C7P1_PYTOL|nr:hypothetical protein Poli38472_014418 [Pythium oligandrum]|eukprot:TMW57815.1 hypothetical protein Poli38472_014418 [Pythium oligandrum]
MQELSNSHQGPLGSHRLEWLMRLDQDMRNADTVLGAFVAGLPQPPKRRAKTSSERGKAFRERQRKLESELEKRVAKLQKEVAMLDMRRRAWEIKYFNTRNSATGSLARLIQEYQHLYQHGLMDLSSSVGKKRGWVSHDMLSQVQLQEEFVRRAIDPYTIVGSAVGPEACIVQWRLYTKSHATLLSEFVSLEISGSDEDPSVVTRSTLTVRFARDTFRMLFPHAMANEALVQKFLGKEITYEYTKHFQFTPDGRISMETTDVNFVDGFVKAGFALEDIAQLMSMAAITSECMIEEVAEEPTSGANMARFEAVPDGSDEHLLPSSPFACEKEASTESNRLSLSFLLTRDATAA